MKISVRVTMISRLTIVTSTAHGNLTRAIAGLKLISNVKEIANVFT